MSGVSVYFLPRAQAARARQVGAEPRVIAPTRRITPLLEPADGVAPSKLSRFDAERLLGIPVRILR